MSDKASLFKASFEFTQDGNTDGTTDTYEDLTIDCESIDSTGCYYVLKTTSGWSIDNIDELKELIDKIDKVITL